MDYPEACMDRPAPPNERRPSGRAAGLSLKVWPEGVHGARTAAGRPVVVRAGLWDS
jgi:hypothetical protein